MSQSYCVLAQTAEEVGSGQESPATGMWPYLLSTAQTQLLNQISVYADKGNTREQLRFLYMNATALRIWQAMGKQVTVVSEIARPPRTALLIFGMPFGE